MQPAEVSRVCSGLRCDRCQRAPTPSEVEEMVAVFGHKLSESDVGAAIEAGGTCVVWECCDCRSKGPAGVEEKKRLRAARWAEWKAHALATGTMTQKEIDDLEAMLAKDKARTDRAIKRNECPECGHALGEKPDFFGRPFTNVFCAAPKPEGHVAHFLVGIDNDELAAMRAS